jgi:aromatic ring-cleaving dioxygenase
MRIHAIHAPSDRDWTELARLGFDIFIHPQSHKDSNNDKNYSYQEFIL